ncbi:hypothetical protein ACRFEN_22235, partial [Klebsiella pneumoniae]
MGRVAFRVDKGKRSLCARADVNVDNYVTSEAEHNHYGLAPIFPDTFYRLTHYWFAAADIPV